MPQERRHVAADNTYGQHSHEHRRHRCRPGVSKPEQTDMQSCRQASSLVWPVTASVDIENDEGAAGADVQMMPACQPCIGNRPEKPAKQDACRADVTTAQNNVYYLVPARALLSIRSVYTLYVHSLRQAFQPSNTAFIQTRLQAVEDLRAFLLVLFFTDEPLLLQLFKRRQALSRRGLLRRNILFSNRRQPFIAESHPILPDQLVALLAGVRQKLPLSLRRFLSDSGCKWNETAVIAFSYFLLSKADNDIETALLVKNPPCGHFGTLAKSVQ